MLETRAECTLTVVVVAHTTLGAPAGVSFSVSVGDGAKDQAANSFFNSLQSRQCTLNLHFFTERKSSDRFTLDFSASSQLARFTTASLAKPNVYLNLRLRHSRVSHQTNPVMFKVRCRYNCENKTFGTSDALRDHMRRTHNLVSDTLRPGRDYTICNLCQRKLLWPEWDKHIVHQKGKLKGEVRVCSAPIDGDNWPELWKVQIPMTKQERADTFGYKVDGVPSRELRDAVPPGTVMKKCAYFFEPSEQSGNG